MAQFTHHGGADDEPGMNTLTLIEQTDDAVVQEATQAYRQLLDEYAGWESWDLSSVPEMDDSPMNAEQVLRAMKDNARTILEQFSDVGTALTALDAIRQLTEGGFHQKNLSQEQAQETINRACAALGCSPEEFSALNDVASRADADPQAADKLAAELIDQAAKHCATLEAHHQDLLNAVSRI